MIVAVPYFAEDMEKSKHTDFNKDTTDESASVACSNIRL